MTIDYDQFFFEFFVVIFYFFQALNFELKKINLKLW